MLLSNIMSQSSNFQLSRKPDAGKDFPTICIILPHCQDQPVKYPLLHNLLGSAPRERLSGSSSLIRCQRFDFYLDDEQLLLAGLIREQLPSKNVDLGLCHQFEIRIVISILFQEAAPVESSVITKVREDQFFFRLSGL